MKRPLLTGLAAALAAALLIPAAPAGAAPEDPPVPSATTPVGQAPVMPAAGDCPGAAAVVADS